MSYEADTIWIDRQQRTGFAGVSEAAWNFTVGGHRVCQKWLQDRIARKDNPARILGSQEIAHYEDIVAAINVSLRVRSQSDEIVDRYGGWPDAFVV